MFSSNGRKQIYVPKISHLNTKPTLSKIEIEAPMVSDCYRDTFAITAKLDLI